MRFRISASLDEPSGLVKRQALEPSMSAVRCKRVRRTPEDLAKLQTSVMAQVRSKAGQRLEEIGRALKTDTAKWDAGRDV